MLKKILFTHDDMDGAGCRILFELANKDLEKGSDYLVVNCPNAGTDKLVMQNLEKGIIDKNTEIYFADICAGLDTFEHLVKNYSIPKVFDHHKTNFPVIMVVPDAKIIVENELGVMQSGTSLLYQHLVSNDEIEISNLELLAEFVDTIRSYDTYEFKSTGNYNAKKLQTLYSLLGMEKFCSEYIKKLSGDKCSDLISIDDIKFVDAKLENEQRIIDSITPDDVYQIDVRGYKTAFTLGGFGVNVSELAHQFLNKYSEFDIFASFSLWRGGEFQFRTIRDDIDVGKDIALPLGGGGHQKASGAKLQEEIREYIVNMLINKMNSVEETN